MSYNDSKNHENLCYTGCILIFHAIVVFVYPESAPASRCCCLPQMICGRHPEAFASPGQSLQLYWCSLLKRGHQTKHFLEQLCQVLNVVSVSHRQTFSVRTPHLFWKLRHMKLGTVWTLFHPLWTFELLLGHIKHPLLGDSRHSENQE